MKTIASFLILVCFTVVGLAQTQPVLKLNNETNLIEATYFHANGTVSQEGTFNLDKQLHGKWTSYNEAGEKIASGKYSNGLKTGKWQFWSGDEVKEVAYSDNAIASVDGIKKEAPVVKN